MSSLDQESINIRPNFRNEQFENLFDPKMGFYKLLSYNLIILSM